MARQLYETDGDRSKEESAKAVLEMAWGAVFHKLPVKYGADWIAVRGGKAVAVLEYKNRPHGHLKYDTYLISLHKWMTVRQVAAEANVRAFLVVEFTDGLYWAEMMDGIGETGVGGRTDRGDPDDVEPCQFVPLSCFTKLRGTLFDPPE